MAQDLELQCKCGRVRGKVAAITPRDGTHVICHCRDCQSFARHLGRSDTLDERGGTEIFQTSAHRVTIEEGADHLACLRLSPKGLMRWYARCCNTPLANTLAGNRFSFAGLLVTALPGSTAAIGPLICRNASKSATGAGESLRDFGVLRALGRFLARAITSRLRGKSRTTPFFHRDGSPIVEPSVLTLEEREAARKG